MQSGVLNVHLYYYSTPGDVKSVDVHSMQTSRLYPPGMALLCVSSYAPLVPVNKTYVLSGLVRELAHVLSFKTHVKEVAHPDPTTNKALSTLTELDIITELPPVFGRTDGFV